MINRPSDAMREKELGFRSTYDNTDSCDCPRLENEGYDNRRPVSYNACRTSSTSSMVPSWNGHHDLIINPYSSTTSSSWSFNVDPELKRQRRVVKYKAYAVEGKMKANLRSGLRWIKNKCGAIVHGY
ncbi:hypothetical protein HS088_TW13G01651 [Tripterygium wilfordii]|uniref:DUF3511 domain protein n=1 Tax=Tripterygium wilfordii TaxID=458696 RepID=A0A7J7CXF2_TRIWF|nr:hypothetical protein HS088_TW13G01651 [Tripterygium wilfordii]